MEFDTIHGDYVAKCRHVKHLYALHITRDILQSSQRYVSNATSIKRWIGLIRPSCCLRFLFSWWSNPTPITDIYSHIIIGYMSSCDLFSEMELVLYASHFCLRFLYSTRRLCSELGGRPQQTHRRRHTKIFWWAKSTAYAIDYATK